MKLIVYAIGKLFECNKDRLNWNQIVALADKNVKTDKEYNNIPMIHPSAICKLSYDFVVIFSSQFFEEIRQELIGEYFIPVEKILPWRAIIGEGVGTAVPFQQFCVEKSCKRILDVGMGQLSKSYLTKREFFLDGHGVIDGIWGTSAILNKNLYHCVYKTYQECKEIYDAAILSSELDCTDDMLECLMEKARYIMLYSGYLLGERNIKNTLYERLQRYGRVESVSTIDGIFWLIDTKEEELTKNVSIYVVTHKDYYIQSDPLYKPLCVGDYQVNGYLSEKEGNNISYLNKKINECTALYWIWKNTNADYVGLNHYRRYFYNNDIRRVYNYLTISHMSAILKEYDKIVA